MAEVATLKTARLQLRGITLDDAPAYQALFADYEVCRYLSSAVPWPFPDDGAAGYLQAVVLPQQGQDRWMWGIFLGHDPETLIGAIELWRQGIPENRGFWLGRPYWGHGYMSEAVAAVQNHAFSMLGFERLVFSNAVANLGSSRVKEKTGARLLGTRPAKFVDPALTEAETWELLKEDWERFSQPIDSA